MGADKVAQRIKVSAAKADDLGSKGTTWWKEKTHLQVDL